VSAAASKGAVVKFPRRTVTQRSGVTPLWRERNKLVQIAKRDLGLDDGDYRALLFDLTGYSSATQCSVTQLNSVLDHFRSRGWKHKAKGNARYAAQADHPTAGKARALWLSLWHLGEVPTKNEEGLEGFARKQIGCERLQWANQGHSYKLIEALKGRCVRAGFNPEAKTVRGIKLNLLYTLLKKLQAVGLADMDWDVADTVAAYFGDDVVRPVSEIKDSELDTIAGLFGDRLREGLKK
jgi:phage gp16-like protein